MTTECSELPLLERIQKYRDMAFVARKEAQDATSQTARRSYVLMAEHWDSLAADAEKKLARPDKSLLE